MADELRGRLVDLIGFEGSVRDPRVLQAMRKVPRHLFVPGVSVRSAYLDTPLPIGHGQTISQPTVVGMMTEALDLKGGERVLEIGTGSGYQAAILSLLAAEVYSIEIVEPLANEARTRLRELGYRVEVRAGDGYAGWPDKAPFDRIVVTAAPPQIPKALTDQLAEGGILVLPVGPRYSFQDLVRIRKVKGKLQRESLGAVIFVPMVPATQGP
ncbi:MAG: protein-L-isoaspartate(D-aspartate) O-methyltransferase [Deltaproteobacteria bacterium]|nr:protein-L-isoaspartate(D-aspartate) O-methyltransferase [Deltaproteobacteria bacterium]